MEKYEARNFEGDELQTLAVLDMGSGCSGRMRVGWIPVVV